MTPRVPDYRPMPCLDWMLYRSGFGHPSWFCRIVERIARRRFVSWEEIEGRILDWYCAKHGYYRGYIHQHGIAKQLRRYWRIGGVIGGRDWTGMFSAPGERNLICRLDENGRRVDSQHCEHCGAGIKPVWGGRPKRRLTCRHPVCHDIERWWWWQRRRAGDGWALFSTVQPELQAVARLWWYLDTVIKASGGGRGRRKAVRTDNGRAEGAAV